MLEYEIQDDVDSESSRRHRYLVGLLFIAVLIFGGLGSTVATTVNLNKGNGVEFGQGIYKIYSCGQWFGIGLIPSEAIYGPGGGFSRVQQVTVQGLDAVGGLNCPKSYFSIQVYDQSSSVMPLFLDSDGSSNKTLLMCIATASSTSAAQRFGAVNLINGAGVNIKHNDGYQVLTYDPTTAMYTWAIGNSGMPLATMSSISTVKLQTSSWAAGQSSC